MLKTDNSKDLKLQPDLAKAKGSDYNITMTTVKNNLKKKDEEKDLLENKLLLFRNLKIYTDVILFDIVFTPPPIQ